MSPLLLGNVVFRDIDRNPRLNRKVKKGIENWAMHHPLDWIAGRVYYLVSFYSVRRDAVNASKSGRVKIACQIEIIGKTDVWIGAHYARNAKEAFSRCIGQLASIRATT